MLVLCKHYGLTGAGHNPKREELLEKLEPVLKDVKKRAKNNKDRSWAKRNKTGFFADDDAVADVADDDDDDDKESGSGSGVSCLL